MELIDTLFAFDKNPLDLFLRVTVMWWFIFLVLRFLMRRDMGEVSASDILLLVLVADAASNGMTDDYKSVTSGMIVVGTLFFWNWFMDKLAMKFEAVERFMEPPPVVFVENGRYKHRVMRREKVTVKDIEGEIRKNGIEKIEDVKYVHMESDGNFSVIPKD